VKCGLACGPMLMVGPKPPAAMRHVLVRDPRFVCESTGLRDLWRPHLSWARWRETQPHRAGVAFPPTGYRYRR
jgi:hypothetical protein